MRNTVHSAGSVRDGVVICRCDKPAKRLVSNTEKNPNRPFYKCMRERCVLWKWEDELPGVGPPQPPQARTSTTQFPATPQQTPEKRPYAHMTTGNRPISRSQPQLQRRAMSPASKERRLADINAALLHNDEDFEEYQVGTTVAGVQTERIPDSDEEEEQVGGHAHGYENGNDNYTAEGEEEHYQPSSKRARFTVKTEDEPQPVTPLRRSSSSSTWALPTPSQTTPQRHPRNDDPYDDGPPSPTSFTLGAQRAMKARANDTGNGKQRASVSVHSEDGGTLVREALTEGYYEEDEDEDAPNEFESEHRRRHENGQAGSAGLTSYQAQLASIYSHSQAHMQTPPPSSSHGNSHLASEASEAFEAVTKQMARAQMAVKAMEQEIEKLRRKLVATEKSVLVRAERIKKLKQENAQLKARNMDLENFYNSFQSLTHMTPPKR